MTIIIGLPIAAGLILALVGLAALFGDPVARQYVKDSATPQDEREEV
jgi:hypothetical protein